MRNLFSSKYMYLTAAMLTGAAMFTSCSNEDDMGNVNPTYDGESVKTQFAINIPAAKQADTRLGQDIVQGQDDPKFRGIGNISLIPFTGTPGSGGTAGTIINLGAIQPDELGKGTGAKVYYDVDLATGVNNFLFYGEAIEATVTGTEKKEKKNGALTVTIPESITDIDTDIKFELVPISTTASSDGERTTLLAALNTVAGASGGGTAWSASTEFQTYYQSFIRLKAGSAASIKLALEDLKEGINSVTPTTETDLKNAILAAIEGAIGTSGTIKDCTYPRNCGLPDGSAQIKWNKDASPNPEFEYITSENIGDLTYTDMGKFVYPTSLYYWVNTPIKTSNKSLADQFTGKASWTECLDLYDGGRTAVDATTASVALEKQINYAVGRFDVAARFSADEVTDNLGATVTINGGGITMDGILIGGQKNLKWDFNTAVNTTEYTIYDADITSTKLTSDNFSQAMAYSLALQTAQGTEINFALELTNNTGDSFTGKDGIVPDGGRFYLIGKLTPVAGTADNRVFYQDHITYAKVTINSLENAYNCIPDLKSPKLELGLSVDLEWQEGLTQDVVIE